MDAVDTLADAQSAVAVFGYDLILLDRTLPDGDGLSLVRTMRRDRDHTPVIVMSAARRSAADRVEGLDIGADDYLAKPVTNAEIVARVKTLLRRPREMRDPEITVGNLTFNLATRSVTIDGESVAIARRELGMLEHLIRAHGRVVSRERIEQSSYGFNEAVSINAIDVSMHRLRRVLSAHKSTAAVHTARGIGYVLQERRQ